MDFTADNHCSVTIAATAFRALEVGYAATRENRSAEDPNRLSGFVAS